MEVSKENFQSLRNMIKERSGIFLCDTKMRFFQLRLVKRLKKTNIDNVKDYYYYIKYDPNGEFELDSLIEEMTINETYFFREKEQLDDFNNEIIPILMEKKKLAQPVKIWSAGCSTGEEPYTLAILLKENPLIISPSNINIMASDINKTALHAAREGVYDDYSLRFLPLGYKDKFFDQTESNKYAVKESVKQSVKFARTNLMDSFATSRIRDMDCVFCRNVIIYFDDHDKAKCIEHLYKSLRSGGYLFPGHSENLSRVSDLFNVVRLKNTVIYQKPE
ncbi:chemotaxis protein methyltransferase CheR [Candidatus Magnetomoraceae bacterium gMMP-1]